MDSPASGDGSPPPGGGKVETFRKLSGDASGRTYRRPVNASQSSDSSSSDEGNERKRSRIGVSQKDGERDVERRRRSYGRTDKDHDRYADRYSYRESRRHEDNRDRRSGRDYSGSSSRSERFDNWDRYSRSKDREREHERYTSSRRRDAESGRRDLGKSPSRYDKNEKAKEKEKSRYRETDDGEMEGVERKGKQYAKENEIRKWSEPASPFDSKAKQQRETKFSKPAEINMEEKGGPSSKQGIEALPASVVGSQAGAGTDLNAAKVAAMKAAEFVNKNIGGGATGGTLTTEQKKKLLWGNKKNESAGSETVKGWNNLFMDRERQEKFNKLMNLRMPWYIWPDVGCEGQCGTRKQARREWSVGEEQGRVGYGLGETVHCWSPPPGRSNCWAWSLETFIMYVAKTFLVSCNSCFMCCTLVEDRLVVGCTIYCFVSSKFVNRYLYVANIVVQINHINRYYLQNVLYSFCCYLFRPIKCRLILVCFGSFN